jgi:very-short-patch-repair endonuclease
MFTYEYLYEKYITERLSPYQIAEENNTNAMYVRRALKKLGIPMRSRGESQKIALESGRLEHPTKGKKASEKTKAKISKGQHAKWTKERKKYQARISKKMWENMSDEKKAHIQTLAHKAIKVTSKEGSKLEKFLVDIIREAGYSVQHHDKAVIPGDKLEVDLLLEDLHTVIEVDGPSHVLPIWGEERLEKTKKADEQKNGLLLSGGYVIIRLQCLAKTTTQIVMRKAKDVILEELKKISQKFPEEGKRLIFLEV